MVLICPAMSSSVKVKYFYITADATLLSTFTGVSGKTRVARTATGLVTWGQRGQYSRQE
jgi:hypothetical protein